MLMSQRVAPHRARQAPTHPGRTERGQDAEAARGRGVAGSGTAAPAPSSSSGGGGGVEETSFLGAACSGTVRAFHLQAASAHALLACVVLAVRADAYATERVSVMQSGARYFPFSMMVAVLVAPAVAHLAFATALLSLAEHAVHVCSSVAFHANRALALPLLFVLAANAHGTMTTAEIALLACTAFTIVYHGAAHDSTGRCLDGEWAVHRRSSRCVHQASVLVPLVGAGVALSETNVPPVVMAARSILMSCELLVAFVSLAFVIAAEPNGVAFARMQRALAALFFVEVATVPVLAAAV